MNKSLLLTTVASAALLAVSCTSTPSSEATTTAKKGPVIWNLEVIDAKAASINAGALNEFYEQMKAEADELLTVPNPSVMSKPNSPSTGTKHDYMSLSRYWWPNPDTKSGLPYVRHDGISNPELNQYDRHRLSEMTGSVEKLALVYYVSGEQKYADKAISRLRTWFTDPETLMNPNLQFAQTRRGHNNDVGHHSGLLDGYSFVEMLDAVELLELKNALPQSLSDSLQNWFAELSEWMLTSENGIAESNVGNNHAIVYDAQVIRYAMYGGRDSLARAFITDFPSRRLATQVEADGQMPAELARTNAFGYTSYNITHMIDICDMAKAYDIEVFSTADNAIERAINWIIPYTYSTETFPYQQIGGWSNGIKSFARVVYRASTYSTDYKAKYLKYYTKNKAPRESAMFKFMYLN